MREGERQRSARRSHLWTTTPPPTAYGRPSPPFSRVHLSRTCSARASSVLSWARMYITGRGCRAARSTACTSSSSRDAIARPITTEKLQDEDRTVDRSLETASKQPGVAGGPRKASRRGALRTFECIFSTFHEFTQFCMFARAGGRLCAYVTSNQAAMYVM